MRYVLARLETEHRDDAYRFYISDALWCEQNNARMNERYAKLIGALEEKPQKSGEEVAAEVIERAGLTVV